MYKYLIYTKYYSEISSICSILYREKVDFFVSKKLKFLFLNEDGFEILKNRKFKKISNIYYCLISEPALLPCENKESNLAPKKQPVIENNSHKYSYKEGYIHIKDLAMKLKTSVLVVTKTLVEHDISMTDDYIKISDIKEKLLGGRDIYDFEFLKLSEMVSKLNINPNQGDSVIVKEIEKRYNLKPLINKRYNIIYAAEKQV